MTIKVLWNWNLYSNQLFPARVKFGVEFHFYFSQILQKSMVTLLINLEKILFFIIYSTCKYLPIFIFFMLEIISNNVFIRIFLSKHNHTLHKFCIIYLVKKSVSGRKSYIVGLIFIELFIYIILIMNWLLIIILCILLLQRNKVQKNRNLQHHTVGK